MEKFTVYSTFVVVAVFKSNGFLLTATHDVYAMRSQLLLGWLKTRVTLCVLVCVWVGQEAEHVFKCLLELFPCGFSLHCYGWLLVISAVRCSSFGFWFSVYSIWLLFFQLVVIAACCVKGLATNFHGKPPLQNLLVTPIGFLWHC